jgi:hypothetical protein
MLGATGALYAIRRALWKPLPPDTILDDVLIPMRIILQGYRVVYEPEAIVFDHLSEQVPDEFSRKVRTLAGNFQLLGFCPSLLLPIRNRVWFQFMSHKVGRLVVPVCLVLLLISSAVLDDGFYDVAFNVQLLWYGVAVCAGIPLFQRLTHRAVSAATAIAAMNLAVVLGLVYIMVGRRGLWRRHSAVGVQSGATPISRTHRIHGPVHR